MTRALNKLRQAARDENWDRVLHLAGTGADNVEVEYLAGFAALRTGDTAAAEARLSALLERAPDHTLTRVALANTYFRLNRKTACLRLLLAGLESDPANETLRKLVVPLLTHTGDPANALILNEQLREQFPDSPDLHLDAAHTWHELQNPGKAIYHYRRTLEEQPRNHRAWCGLGLSLQQTGALDDARAAHQQALMLQPRCGHYHYNMASMAGFEPHPSHITTIETLIAASDDRDDRANLNFALARLREQTGDVDGTWTALVAANAARRRTFGYDRNAFRQRVDNIMRFFSPVPQHLALPDDPGQPVPLFIVGLPRSGSTLLEQMLSNHPAVTGRGEQKLLNNLLDERGGVVFDRQQLTGVRDAYMARINSATPWFVDKMPSNFALAGLIHLMFPRGRVILMERDRDATLYSCYRQQFVDQKWTFDFRDIARYEADYARLIDFWDQVLPDTLLHVSYDELVRAPEPTLRRLLKTCELPWHDACLKPETNLTPVATASAQQVRQPISDHEAARLAPWLDHFGVAMAAARREEKNAPGA